MRTQRTSRYLLALACVALLAFPSGCSKTAERSEAESNTISIQTLLDNPKEFNDRQVRVSGTVTSSVGAFGSGTYDVNDGTGTLTVITDDDTPGEGTRVEVQGEFESLFTIGDLSGAVLKERERRLL
jgi:hypothetical protein